MIIREPLAFCTLDHQVEYAQKAGKKRLKQIEADAKKAEKEDRRIWRQRKQAYNEKTLKWQKNRTKDVVHELIKLLDKDQPCIVCGGFDCGNRSEWDAGHYLTKAAHPELALCPINIYKQCSLTNTASTGRKSNEASIRHKFEQGIIGRMGMDVLMWLKGYHAPKKWTCEELSAMRAEMTPDIKRLKQGLPALKNWRQLPPTNGKQGE